MRKGMLIIISGPSGVGKDTIFKALKKRMPELRKSVSVTTRPCRQGETDGIDYIFADEASFRRMAAEGSFLEWALVHGNLYGTPIQETERLRREGRNVVLVIDVRGADLVRQACADALFIFLAPPSREELIRRLEARGSENQESLSKRLAESEREMSLAEEYDYVLTNDDVEDTAERLAMIIIQEDQKRKGDE